MEKKTRLTTEEALLKARKENLDHVNELTAMKAHGKVHGMDTFSWVNPSIQSLINVIESFPFSVVWLGGYEQVKKGFDLNIAIHEKLDSLIIYDRTNPPVDASLVKEIKTVLCVEDIDTAFEFIKAVDKSKMVFLFTTEGDRANENWIDFEKWLSILK